ncbi:MAG: NADH kinase pos5 [Thelocarpon superellum]|nr:MAG: NADH kinase pos5 [Thelocarpon superellum]
MTFAKHLHATYPEISIVLEPHVAAEVHDHVPFPVYAPPPSEDGRVSLHEKVDITATHGGDGTILHASSLFTATPQVPPILSFSMGTLGFLGEWKFQEFPRAFREVYESSAETGRGSRDSTHGARVLLRNRLKVGVFDASGRRISGDDIAASAAADIHAMNEVIIHRGKDPHLAIVELFVGGRFLTEAVADGMIVSTPTGSTAYSLSSGGSIVHPLVPSLLLTPICPRSLSFRPLVLPATTSVTLRLSEKNRGREMEVSIDGRRRTRGVGVGMEVRVWGEEIQHSPGSWTGGVPCIMRGAIGSNADGDDAWVGGLNGLLKFNYPFGEDT